MVIFPILCFVFATLAALAFGYGVDPRLMRFEHGLEMIIWARRMQWLSASLSLMFCVGAIALIIGGKRRIWWLVGLAPVFILFVHRFTAGPAHGMSVVDNPTFVDVDHAVYLHDDDAVVGLHFSGNSYAYPYRELFARPVLVQADQNKRMVLMWSVYANRAVAYTLKGEVRARELEIVSVPANALLLYNARRGQFINGLTGKTREGELPAGFIATLPTYKMSWGQWRTANPKTKVLEAKDEEGGPNTAMNPYMPMPAKHDSIEPQRVALLATTQPVAMVEERIVGRPLNLMAGKTPVMVVRDGGRVWCFNRTLEEDQPAQFGLNTDVKRKGTYIDSVTKSTWTIAGGEMRAMDGPAATKPPKHLSAVAIDSALPWNVMKYWYPELELVEGQEWTAPKEGKRSGDRSR